MEIFLVNTDAKSNQKHSYHDVWLARGIAVASGSLTWQRDLSRISDGDLVGIYVNKVGVVACGIPLDDHVVEVRDQSKTVSPTEPFERHRRIDWLLDLRSAPLSISELGGLGVKINAITVRRVVSGRQHLELRLRELLSTLIGGQNDQLRAAFLQRMTSNLGYASGPRGVGVPR